MNRSNLNTLEPGAFETPGTDTPLTDLATFTIDAGVISDRIEYVVPQPVARELETKMRRLERCLTATREALTLLQHDDIPGDSHMQAEYYEAKAKADALYSALTKI